ncbi:MAG: c-type cytochrome [Desulfobulbaceae bacterium]
MTKKAAFHIFLWGTLSSAVLFLWLTWDTHRQVAVLSNADKLSAQVIAGKRTFEKYNCNDCHTILGFGGYYAPDLTKVVKRLGSEGVAYRIRSPEKAFAGSKRKMAQQHVSDEEIGQLVAFFTWVGEIDNGDWPPQDSDKRFSRSERRLLATTSLSPGAAVIHAAGCLNCHSLRGEGDSDGPPLDTVGRNYSEEELEHYIKNPQEVDPSSAMPPQSQLSERELEEVAKFLSQLQ